MKKILQIITTLMIILPIVGGIAWHRWTVNQLEQQIQQQAGAHTSRVAFLSDSLSNVVEVVDRQGDTIQKAKQTIISLENAVQMGLIREIDLRNKYLKEVELVVSLKEEIKILNKPGEYLPPNDSTPVTVPEVPIIMEFSDPWYYTKVTAGPEFPVIDSMVHYNYPKLTSGWTKQPGLRNIFVKPIAEVYYENSNPYSSLVDIEYIKIDPVQKWYQTGTFKFGAGFTVGVGFVITMLSL